MCCGTRLHLCQHQRRIFFTLGHADGKFVPAGQTTAQWVCCKVLYTAIIMLKLCLSRELGLIRLLAAKAGQCFWTRRASIQGPRTGNARTLKSWAPSSAIHSLPGPVTYVNRDCAICSAGSSSGPEPQTGSSVGSAAVFDPGQRFRALTCAAAPGDAT